MALTSFPFDSGPGASVSESNYSRFFRELRESGVADDANTGNGFRVSAPGGSMTVSVASGLAILRGHAAYADSPEPLTIGAASTSTRFDRVVLRLDPANNNIDLVVIAGTPGAGAPPTPEATDTGLWDLPLATVTVAPGTAAITGAMILDERRFVGSDVGVWKSDALRPISPRFGRMGFNIQQARWEYWSGSSWVAISSAVAWADITGKPSGFTSSPHGHDWADITGKPASFVPSTHVHSWLSLTGRPSSFPPEAHTHSYAPLNHTHNYEVVGHTHPGSEITSATNRSNGSDRPHSNTPQGSTWYAVWVDGNKNFCRNTSSIKYKKNVRDIDIDPDKVLQIQPRVYDRKGDDTPDNEFGLIAEEVHLLVPELVTFNEGEIDGLRYDLLGVALLSVVKRQQQQIDALTARLDELEA